MEIRDAICRIKVIAIIFIALTVNKYSEAFLGGGHGKRNQVIKICDVCKFTFYVPWKPKASRKLDSTAYNLGINIDFLELRIQSCI